MGSATPVKFTYSNRMSTPTSAPPPTTSENPKRVYHPFLLALFPVLSLVADHLALISFNRTVLRIGTGMISLATFCFFALKTIFKNTQKAALLVSSGILLFSTYGYVFDYFSQKHKKINHRLMLSVWATIEIFVTGLVLKSKGTFQFLNEFLNVVSGMLVILSLVQILSNQLSRKKKPPSKIPITSALTPHQPLPKQNFTKATPHPKRDIYYLIIDGHARADTIQEQYGLENYNFPAALQQEGFYVAQQSRSNYAMTMLSLASSLNGNYIHTLMPDLVGSTEKNIYETQVLIEDNFSMRFLKKQGYKIVFLGSGFSITQNNRHADLNIPCGQIDEPTGRFIQSTLLRPLADRMHWIENDKRQRILRMFSELEQLPSLTGPKFVFAHIPAPQWPFLFDAQGKATHFGALDTTCKKKAYLNQLLFIDQKVETWVKHVLKNSPTPPIIVIQADHGPNFAFEAANYAQTSPCPEILREKMQIINAYFLPDTGQEALYAYITPVNTFRLIFNHYFGANLPMLQDQSYFSTLDKPFQLAPIQSQFVTAQS